MFNRFIHWIARSPFHRVLSGAIAVVQYQGRRSGKPFAVPVNYVITGEPDKRRLWITSLQDRVWWRNFIGGYEAVLLMQGESLPIELIAVRDELEVQAGLAQYLTANTRAARYFDVELNENGQPKQDDLRRAARERVIIYAQL